MRNGSRANCSGHRKPFTSYPYPHGQTVTLSLYWAGQLGIALAARWTG